MASCLAKLRSLRLRTTSDLLSNRVLAITPSGAT